MSDHDIENGMWCYRCGGMASRISQPLRCGYRRLCPACERFDSDSGAVSSSCRLRCPKCRAQWDHWETESNSLLDEGHHDVSCPECDHDFTVETTVSYSFESPAFLTEEDSRD